MASYLHFDQIPLLRYGAIMADPPWLYQSWTEKGAAKNPSAHYRCMPLDEIKALPVDHLAAPDCILWLWATNPMLPQALEVMAAWNFKYVTAGHWVKRGESGKLAFGTGYALRCAGEPFLIGKIGKPKFSRRVRSVIEAPRRENSRKPESAFAAFEEMAVGTDTRIELFSRQERKGWDVFGDEVGKF
jgi:N6-adenosine-specific RNA methylase IME4